MKLYEYNHDAPFWYALAMKARTIGDERLGHVFDNLNRRAAELELPITFGGEKSTSWAVMCQLFLLYNSQTPPLNRAGYARMISAFKRAFRTARFVTIGMKRIVANITYPSSPHRTVEECVADTFLANGVSVTDAYDDSSWDDIILSRSLSDPEMMSLCTQAVTPPAGLWEEVTEYYAHHRPGLFERMSFTVTSWFLD